MTCLVFINLCEEIIELQEKLEVYKEAKETNK